MSAALPRSSTKRSSGKGSRRVTLGCSASRVSIPPRAACTGTADHEAQGGACRRAVLCHVEQALRPLLLAEIAGVEDAGRRAGARPSSARMAAASTGRWVDVSTQLGKRPTRKAGRPKRASFCAHPLGERGDAVEAAEHPAVEAADQGGRVQRSRRSRPSGPVGRPQLEVLDVEPGSGHPRGGRRARAKGVPKGGGLDREDEVSGRKPPGLEEEGRGRWSARRRGGGACAWAQVGCARHPQGAAQDLERRARPCRA